MRRRPNGEKERLRDMFPLDIGRKTKVVTKTAPTIHFKSLWRFLSQTFRFTIRRGRKYRETTNMGLTGSIICVDLLSCIRNFYI